MSVPGLPLHGKGPRSSLVVVGDIHFDDYPKFPDMFGHLQDAFRDAVEASTTRQAPMVIVGDTLNPLHGSISAKVLDPVCELFEAAGQQTRINMFKGNHARGAIGTGDHLETPLGMINGVAMHNTPELRELGPFICGMVPYVDSKEEFIEAVKKLTRELKTATAGSKVPKLLFTHQGYKGGYVGPEEPGYSPDEDQGGWSLPVTLFAAWDQVISGHYHNHQTLYLGETPITYAGALLQHNFGDEGQTRGYVLVEYSKASGIQLKQVASHVRYPTFRKPRIKHADLKALRKEDLSGCYFQPVIVDPAVTEDDLKALEAYKIFPTLWETYDKGTNRLGDVTADSSVEEILAGYVEARCPNFPEEVKERLLAVGLETYYKNLKTDPSPGTRGAIRFLELELQHFRRSKHETFTFPKNGTTCFVGKNGSGKSTPRMGLIYGVYGEMPGDAESPINDLVGKACMVRTRFSIDAQIYTILRHRKDPVNKDKLFFFKGTEIPAKGSEDDYTGATNSQTQKSIDQIFGIELEIFEAIVCISSLFKLYSDKVRDNAKREFLERAFGLGIWETPYQSILEALRTQREAIKELETTLASQTAVKDNTRLHISDLRLKSESWDREQRRDMSTIGQEIEQLDSRLAKLAERPSADPAEAQAALQEKKDALEELSKDGEPERKRYLEKRIELTERIGALKNKRGAASTQIEQIEKDRRFGLPMAKLGQDGASQVCPTCRQPVTVEHIEECQKAFMAEKTRAMRRMREEFNAADGELKEKLTLRTSLDARLSRIDGNIKARRELKDEIQVLTEKLSGQKEQYSQQKRLEDGLQRQKQMAKDRIAALKKKEDPYKTLIRKAKLEAVALIAEITQMKADLEAAKARVEDLRFWEKGYSKTGLRSYLLDSYLPRLTEKIQEQLDVLSDGALRTKLSANRLNQDGENSETFTTECVNLRGGNTYAKQSAGEAHRVDIAVAFGVNAYSRAVNRHSVNTLFVDDVMDCFIDEEGALALSRLIKNFSKDIWVGVATNEPVIASQFEKKVRVSRDSQGFSKYLR